MITKIFLVRHAEAEGNLFRVAHGQYNSTITPRGYRQLSALRDRFLGEHLDAVYGSDLLRAHTTASALYLPKNLPFRPLPLLREICLGDWEQASWGEILRRDKQLYGDFNRRPDVWHTQGAETFAQVRDRMVQAVWQMARENPGATVAATSHGAALRTLLGTLEGMSLREIGATGHGDNTAVSLLEVEGESIRVVFRDDASHVPPQFSTFRRQNWQNSDAATAAGLWFQVVAQNGEDKTIQGMLEDTPVGRAAFHREPDTLRLSDFEVFPDFRGERYGVQLLGQGVRYARELGLETLVVTCPASLADYFLKYAFGEKTVRGDTAQVTLDFSRVLRPIP
jgi:probable phosphoglycerate mutase